MKRIPYLLFPIMPMVLIGCGSILTSQPQPALANTAKPVMGIPYYLPTGTIHIDGAWDDKKNEWVVTISTVIQPDTRFRYELTRKANAFFDDDISLATDKNGLLQAVSAASEDKTVAALGDLISAAGNALTFGASLGAGVRAVPSGATSFHYVFDPYSDSSGSFHPKNLAPASTVEFEITATPLITADRHETATVPADGIVVRIPMPYEVSIKQIPPLENTNNARQRQIVFLPDVFHNYVVSFDRAPLLKYQTSVTLADGMLQGLKETRPSLVAGIAGVPKTILGALSPIPLNVQQAQTNMITAMDNRLKAEADIKKLQGQ